GRTEVAAVDVLLVELTRALRHAVAGTRAMGVALGAGDRLLSLPAHPRFDDPEVARAAATEGIEAIAVEPLARGWVAGGDAGRPGSGCPFDVAGEPWWVAARVVAVEGLPLTVVVASPAGE